MKSDAALDRQALFGRAIAFVGASEAARSVDELLALFMTAVAPCGVVHAGRVPLLGARGRPAVGQVVGIHNPEYQLVYGERGFVHSDPVLATAINSTNPLLWNSIRSRIVEPASLDVFNVAADFGGRNGLVVPLHHRLGSVNAVVMSGYQLDDSPETRAFLHLVAIHFHTALERIELQTKDADSQLRALTARQTECLRWVAAGKSDWEIGEILNISEHTVHRHVELAKARLNVRTRAQAIAELLRRAPDSVN